MFCLGGVDSIKRGAICDPCIPLWRAACAFRLSFGSGFGCRERVAPGDQFGGGHHLFDAQLPACTRFVNESV